MEQGNRLDSTLMSAAQAVRDDAGEDHALDAAVAALLTASSTKAAVAAPALVAMVAEWERLLHLENHGNLSDEEADPIMSERVALHARICAFPAATVADLAAKLPLFRDEVVNSAPHDSEKPTLDYQSWCCIVRDLGAAGAGFAPAASRTGGVVRVSADADADAGLLALGREFDALHAEWTAAARAQDEAEEEVHTLRRDLENRLGWTAMEALEVAWATPGANEAVRRADAATGAMEPVLRSIRALPARTLDGLAVKARAVIPCVWMHGQFETDADPDTDENWLELNTRSLIDECLRLAGVNWKGQRFVDRGSCGNPGRHPDAALIALGDELEAARAREQAAEDEWQRRTDAAAAAMPGRPDCLIFRGADHAFNLRQGGLGYGPSDIEGSPVTQADVRWMTRRAARRQIKRPVQPCERAWHDFPGHVLDLAPWPEAQARIDEIVTAWDAWHEAQRAVDATHGVPDAEDRATQVGAEGAAIAERIAALPALTAEGMRVKLRAIAFAVPSMNLGVSARAIMRSLMGDAGVPLSEMGGDAPETEA